MPKRGSRKNWNSPTPLVSRVVPKAVAAWYRNSPTLPNSRIVLWRASAGFG